MATRSAEKQEQVEVAETVIGGKRVLFLQVTDLAPDWHRVGYAPGANGGPPDRDVIEGRLEERRRALWVEATEEAKRIKVALANADVDPDTYVVLVLKPGLSIVPW